MYIDPTLFEGGTGLEKDKSGQEKVPRVHVKGYGFVGERYACTRRRLTKTNSRQGEYALSQYPWRVRAPNVTSTGETMIYYRHSVRSLPSPITLPSAVRSGRILSETEH